MSDVLVLPPSAQRIDAYKVAVTYAKDVLEGRIVTGKLLKLAAKRFISDLKSGPARGISFNKSAAQHVVDFFCSLRHFQGEWGTGQGLPFIPSPWQVFILANLFGFCKNGKRRFNEAHIEVARKNGKTTLMAGIALYMLAADDEPAAQIFCIATKKDQAREVFDAAVQMRRKSPFLSQRVSVIGGVKPYNLHVLQTASKFELQASDYGTADGKNVHCLIADELHQHPSHLLYSAYKEATVGRRQPLCVAITTAGYDQHSFCYTRRVAAENILVGNVEASEFDHFFAFIACIDEPDRDGKGGDDPFNEACWAKANPNLGVSPKLESLRQQAAMAKLDPVVRNTFLCKHMNVWVNQEICWMDPAKWAACNAAGPLASPRALRAAALEKLLGRICVGGLDLSTNTDLCAFALLFPPTKDEVEQVPKRRTQEDIWKGIPQQYDEVIIKKGDPKWSILLWFWVPEMCIAERVKKDRVKYDVWRDEGYLNICPGNVINHEFIYKQILELRKLFRFEEISMDAWNAQWLSQKLKADGFTSEEARPTYPNLSEPMKELMGLVLEKKLEHFADPILAWNANNVQATMDPMGYIKPDKKRSKEKIDGIVAVILAIHCVVKNPKVATGSGWDYSKGIIFI